MLKDLEKNQAVAKKKDKPSLRRRLEQAGFPNTTPRTFWIMSGILAASVAALAFLTRQSWLVILLAAFAAGLGLPRWVLNFLIARRKKKFTENFAGAIDVIVRSVRSGLPTNEALRIVARESPDPVGAEFNRMVEGLKKSSPRSRASSGCRSITAEVEDFAVDDPIQLKSGGNLSGPG